MMRLRRTENGRDVAADVDGMGEDNRNIVRDRGGAPTFPTVQWLAGFPDEREAVLEYLRGGLPESPYRELILLASIGAVFERGEPLVPADVRVRLYEIVAGLPHLTVEELTIDGRQVWSVMAGAERTYGHGLLFDAESGRTVGSRAGWIGTPPSGAPTDRRPADYTLVRMWLSGIVGDLGQRP